MDWLVKNAQNRDVERQHLNKILQDIRSTLNELEARMSRDSSEEARIRAVVSKMLTSGTQSGISVTYNAMSKAIDFAVRTFTIQLTGDVTGTATVTGLGNVSINTTLAAENEGVEEAPMDGQYYWRSTGAWIAAPTPLQTIDAFEGAGILVLDQDYNWYARSIEGTASEIVVTDGDGIAANPVIGLADLPDDNTGTFKLITRDAKGRVEGTLDGDTDDVPEGVANLYFTDARARAAVIAATIVNGDTTHSPSGDAVFDALALKADTTALASYLPLAGGTMTGNIVYNVTPFQVVASTSDGSDTSRAAFSGGGAVGAARGGYVICFGNESATQPGSVNVITGNGADLVFSGGNLRPSIDNTYAFGAAAQRWTVIYAATGTINTSDAREKTAIQGFTANELKASMKLASEIGTYKWLSAIEAKGDAARQHVGLTVQRVIQIMEECGLDPFAYGFICYDEWDSKPELWDDVPEELDADGNVVAPSYRVKLQDALPAGNRYSFRMDELTMFIARGQEERLRKIEAALNLEEL